MTENDFSSDELISLAEAAQICGDLTQDTLRRYAWNGRLQAKKIGRNYVTTRRWVENYLRSRHRGQRNDLENET